MSYIENLHDTPDLGTLTSRDIVARAEELRAVGYRIVDVADVALEDVDAPSRGAEYAWRSINGAAYLVFQGIERLQAIHCASLID